MDSALARAFAADGVVHLPGAIPSGLAAAWRAALAATLAAAEVDLDRPATWRVGGPMPMVELVGALRPGPSAVDRLWSVGTPALQAELVAAFGAALDRVFGPARWAAQPGVQAMPNLPRPGPAWQVPHQAWHVDEPTAPGQAAPWGVLGFAVLDEIAPGGGATVAIAGSHRRLAGLGAPGAGLITTDLALAALAAEPGWREVLTGAPPATTRSWRDGAVDLEVRELTGAAGDLILMDPRVLHTISANRSTRPRLVMRLVAAQA